MVIFCNGVIIFGKNFSLYGFFARICLGVPEVAKQGNHLISKVEGNHFGYKSLQRFVGQPGDFPGVIISQTIILYKLNSLYLDTQPKYEIVRVILIRYIA